jgi:hypothetical protein
VCRVPRSTAIVVTAEQAWCPICMYLRLMYLILPPPPVLRFFFFFSFFLLLFSFSFFFCRLYFRDVILTFDSRKKIRTKYLTRTGFTSQNSLSQLLQRQVFWLACRYNLAILLFYLRTPCILLLPCFLWLYPFYFVLSPKAVSSAFVSGPVRQLVSCLDGGPDGLYDIVYGWC